MKVQLDKLVQSPRGEILCEFCGRQWFGLVAYCPYCGRKPAFTMITQAADRLRSDKSRPSGQVETPAREPATRNEAGGTPLPRVPPPAENIRELHLRDKPRAARSSQGASASLSKTAVASVGALLIGAVGALLLFWFGFKLLAPKTNEGASPQPPTATSGIALPRPGASTSAAPLPPRPARTDTPVPVQPSAAQAPPIAPRTDASVRPPSNARSLCSPASEAAGLCRPQG